MNDSYRFPVELRELMVSALPEDTSLHGTAPQIRYTYLPATHAKALRPDSMLVQGIRGSGKSYWWSVLQKPEYRAVIGKQADISEETIVSTGFGETPSPDDYPGKDTIAALRSTFEPRSIWLTIVMKHVGGDHLPTGFRSRNSWQERVDWVRNNPEPVERCLYEADHALEERGVHHLVLFDALDRITDDWASMHELVRGLLQVLLDFRSYSRIRLKVFVRPDQIENTAVTAFPDSSKVLSQSTQLNWPRNELYGLLWQYLANGDSGAVFRDGCTRLANIKWINRNNVWLVPDKLRNDEATQRIIFHALAGPWMGKDRRRGFPYTWLPSHLADARKQVSPRSFLAALNNAAQDKPRANQVYVLHYESIKQGVQEASKIRVRELQEDYPWVQQLLAPLSGISVPCPSKEIMQIWFENEVLDTIQSSVSTMGVRLPPAKLDLGEAGVLMDLIDLGLVELLSDNRVNLPDVYRVGYGIGRRGGIKPVAR